jgi:hypothetical protein
MAVRRKGNTTPRIVGEGRRVMPSGEVYLDIMWEGFEPDLQSLQLQYAASGYEADIEASGVPWKRMRVSIPNANVPGSGIVDIWEITSEFAQVDIRNHPNIIAQAGGNVTTLNSWYKQAKNADEESSLPSDPGFIVLFNHVALGVEAFEEERLVLRNRRMFPNVSLGQIDLSDSGYIYSTARLKTTFSIPPEIANELPTEGTVASPAEGFGWGWKLRGYSSIFNRSEGKRELLRDWVFAAWSEWLYVHLT